MITLQYLSISPGAQQRLCRCRLQAFCFSETSVKSQINTVTESNKNWLQIQEWTHNNLQEPTWKRHVQVTKWDKQWNLHDMWWTENW